jgi:hypothetical protein
VWRARRAEYSIRFSKDAKEYAKQQKLKKDAQIHQIQEYVKELVLVYAWLSASTISCTCRGRLVE